MKNILIYGTSRKAVSHLGALALEYKVLGFIDSNINLRGSKLFQLPIYHYQDLSALKYDLIVIASSYCQQIQDTLLSLGINNAVNIDKLDKVIQLQQEFVGEEIKHRKIEVTQIPLVSLRDSHISHTRLIENRAELLKLLPKQGICAELGVANGDFSRQILELNQPCELHLIDVWQSDRYNEHLFDNVTSMFKSQIDSCQVIIHRHLSQDAVHNFPDEYFDWIYIDTTHTYPQTKLELELYSKKVKSEGIIAGHDYSMGNWVSGYKYGVIEAVYEFCVNNGYTMKYLTMDLAEAQSFAIFKEESNNPGGFYGPA